MTGNPPARSYPLPMGFSARGDGVVMIGPVRGGIAMDDGGGVDDVPGDGRSDDDLTDGSVGGTDDVVPSRGAIVVTAPADTCT